MKTAWSMVCAAGMAVSVAHCARGQVDMAQVDIGTVEAAVWTVPADLTLRVRVTAMDPAEPTPIQWRYGGEGMGGNVIRGAMPRLGDEDTSGLPTLDAPKAVMPGAKAPGEAVFDIGEWSAPVPVATFKKAPWPNRLFVTFTVGRAPKTASPTDRTLVSYTKGVALEFEIAYQGKTIKSYTETSPDGSTAGLVIWPERWTGQDPPDFGAGVMGLLEYATLRADHMEALPWGKGELPRQFSIVTDLGGYGNGYGYGIRHGSKAIIKAEARTLRQLGVNSLRALPPFLVEQLKQRQDTGADFARSRIVQVGGYPVVPRPRVKNDDLEAGCPFSPRVPGLKQAAITSSLDEMRGAGTPEVWGLTVDEIGVVFDGSNDGKAHVEKCPLCRTEFVNLLKRNNVSPADLGKSDWADVKPFLASPKTPDPSWMQTPGMPLTAYYTKRFLAEASAAMFTPLRDAVAAANRAKKSVAGDSPASAQPLMHTYALRGNTFLLGGHSLDFFDYYRLSDNGFVYETSNRDPRIHQWDSYLCDVGRVVTADQGLAFGVYVKPHRGAVIQRAISAISRGATMLFWYTYGPDYGKGDCFSSSLPMLELTAKAAHLIGKAENALYGARWAKPARIGIVKPNTTEVWLGILRNDPVWTASWENAKWIYSALVHDHLSVDPLDETMLEDKDLSGYEVLYVHGPNLRQKAAARLEQWVRDGGTLYASGWSLARDEANQPLDRLLPVLGLESRRLPEMFLAVECYRAGSLDPFDARDPKQALVPEVPAGARIRGDKPFESDFTPRVGREVLNPAAGTEVLARFADGSAAMTRHPYGKGQAYVAGFFPGLEYSAAIRNNEYDMSRQFDENLRRLITAPALANVEPVVNASVPEVEGVLLTNASNGTRCVTLMNWAYRVSAVRVKGQGTAERRSLVTELVEQSDLLVTVRGAGRVGKIRSAMLDTDLIFEQTDELLKIRIPRMQEADVLLLE